MAQVIIYTELHFILWTDFVVSCDYQQILNNNMELWATVKGQPLGLRKWIQLQFVK